MRPAIRREVGRRAGTVKKSAAAGLSASPGAASSRQFPRRYGWEKRGGERTCRSAGILPARRRRARSTRSTRGQETFRRKRTPTEGSVTKGDARRQRSRHRLREPRRQGRRPRRGNQSRRNATASALAKESRTPRNQDDCRGRPRRACVGSVPKIRARRHAPQAAKRLNVRQRFRRTTRASSGRASGLPPSKTMARSKPSTEAARESETGNGDGRRWPPFLNSPA